MVLVSGCGYCEVEGSVIVKRVSSCLVIEASGYGLLWNGAVRVGEGGEGGGSVGSVEGYVGILNRQTSIIFD